MTIREPAVAGSFYPEKREQLSGQLSNLLDKANSTGIRPKALIVPHAGYQYSGATAAAAYGLLRPYSQQIKKVVLLGPSHHYPLQGAAVPHHVFFATPLGTVLVDQQLKAKVASLPQVITSDAAHRAEHSLEVQLPFLQTCLGDGFSILPIVVGWMGVEDVCNIIASIPVNDDTLLVISTDLSHFHRYDQACAIDADTIQRIMACDVSIQPEQACGAHALDGFLRYCQKQAWQPELLSQCNSGDVSGDTSRVVGYASFALH